MGTVHRASAPVAGGSLRCDAVDVAFLTSGLARPGLHSPLDLREWTPMTKLRLLPILALSATLLLPSVAAVAQDEATEASPAADATMAVDDDRLAELEALVPMVLAGLPLTDNLRLATGEELASVMSPEEVAVLGALLEANGKTVSDYGAASTWLPITDTDIVVIQAHRIRGVDAEQTKAAWVEILSMGLEEPQIADGFIGGRPVTLVSDGAHPEVPLLHVFPARDVMWMVVAADQAIVEEAMKAIDASAAEAAAVE
jgi:hypothetical protein